MPQMFDFARPMLKKSGIRVGRDWQETKETAANQAVAQLSRANISSATMVKWHRIGAVVGARPRSQRPKF